MSETQLVRCPSCGVTNRVPLDKVERGLSPVCGRCKAPVSVNLKPVTVTDATFWSDTVGEAKQSAVMVAVNHSRAQILAPHTDVDPWVGLDRSVGLSVQAPHDDPAEVGGGPAGGYAPDPAAPPPGGWIGGTPETGTRDVWGLPVAPAAADPWTSPSGQDSWGTAPKPAPPTPGVPSVPPSRTGLLGRVHGTSGGGLDLPRPSDEPDPYDKG